MQKQTTHIWHLLALYGRKVSVLLLLVLAAPSLKAQQLNLPQYDTDRRLHFGFTLNGAFNNLQLNTSPDFFGIDSVRNIKVIPFYGFGLGAVVDFRLNKWFNLRFLGPTISFAQRNIQFEFDSSAYNRDVQIESVYLDFPLELKFRAERRKNTRFYTMVGIRYTYDLSSDIDAPRSLNDPVVALRPSSFNWEVGIGLDMYLPFFKFSPEIKLSQSFNNVLVKDDFVYTKSINSLFSRIVTVSFHFE